MEKFTIKNRKNQNIVVLVEQPEVSVGLVFVAHALGGHKDDQITTLLRSIFLNDNYTVVCFDTTNSFGESDGVYEDATVTNYYADLEDVISRSTQQQFYQEPFVLSGYSLGGMTNILYAEKYPERVRALALLAPLLSGKLSISIAPKEKLEEWKNTGRRIQKRSNGGERKLKWSHMEDRLLYDVFPFSHMLTMPIILFVGDKDESAPAAHQQLFYNALLGPRELCVINNAVHALREDASGVLIKSTLHTWLQKINTSQN